MKKILYLVFALILFSCKKKTESVNDISADVPCYYYPLSKDLQKVDYKVGSYWVLFDSIQNRYDSLTVSYNNHYTQEYPMHKGMSCPNKADRIHHSIDLYYCSPAGSVTKASVNENYVEVLVSENNQSVIHGYPNCYPSTCPIKIYHNFDSIPNDLLDPVSYSKFDSLPIHQRFYKKVRKLTTGAKAITSYYFNSENGFLRFYASDSTGKVTLNKSLVRQLILK